jgi:hypothetical protein
LVNGCTTIFTEPGDTYIIDTPYIEFMPLFKDYHSGSDNEAMQSKDDIEL